MHDGLVVVVPARAAAWLERHADLRALRIRNRGTDPDVDAVLIALAVAAAGWRERVGAGTAVARPAEPGASSWLSTAQAADLLGLTDRGVRKAATDGRLSATKAADGWRIQREDAEHYRAARAASRGEQHDRPRRSPQSGR